MIKEELEQNKLHSIQISFNQKFQYIRYVRPEAKNTPISEFEVYGDFDIIEEVSKHYYQLTNLPLLVINSENGEMPQVLTKTLKLE